MTEEKKKIPSLRFPEFERNWEEKKIGNCTVKVGSGSTPKGGSKIYTKEGIPFIRSQNVYENRLVLADIVYITAEIDSKMKGSRIKPLDILLNITGASIGRSCVVPKTFTNGNLNQHVSIIRLKEDYSPYFLQLNLSSFKGQKKIARMQAGGGREGINFDAIRSIKVLFPSLPEQTKIANFLTTIDTRLQQLHKKKTLLGQYKKGVMQKIFLQEVKFKDDEGKKFPSWEVKQVGDFLIERNTKAPKSEKFPLMSFVAQKGVTPKGERYNREFLVKDGDNKKYKQTEYGDFIYSSNNLETGSIGLNRYGSACISPVYSIFQIRELCDYRFISTYLVRKSFLNKMVRFRQGVVYGQWRIHESDFLKIEEKIPSNEEQKKIADFLTIIDEKISFVSQQIQKTEAYKKGLLQRMFV